MGLGPVIQQIAHLSSHIASRTRRGGQSAGRFGRSRLLEELEFLRKVAARVAQEGSSHVLSRQIWVNSQELSDVEGLILGGCAGMKYKLASELPPLLRRRIACVVTLNCSAGWGGVRKAAVRIPEVRREEELRSSESVLEGFFRTLDLDPDWVCYGEAETKQALDQSSAKQLLISESHSSLEEWLTMANLTGSDAMMIRPSTASSQLFCKAYGIGALLRWPKFEEDAWESDSEVSTQEPETPMGAWWLREALLQAGLDEASAESLAIGVDLVLTCELRSAEERFTDALDLLQQQEIPSSVLEDFCLLLSDSSDFESD